MTKCSYCGRDNPQTDAAYCSYCGSSLSRQSSNVPTSSQRSQPTYPTSRSPALGLSERYEKALKRAELLGTILLVLGVAAVVLLLV